MLSHLNFRRTSLWIIVAVLPLVVTIVSMLVTLATQFSHVGVIAGSIITLFVIIACVLWLRPVLLPTISGRRLLEAVEQEGLEDVISREREAHQRTPAKVFDVATQELAICGYTAYGTIKELALRIDQFLSDGRKHLYLLVIDPKSTDLAVLHEQVDLSAEIKSTLHLIEERQLHLKPNFHLKLMSRAPSWTGTLIDGDITSLEEARAPHDTHGHIRVQPRRSAGTIHEGVIIQFAKHATTRRLPFDYFADDLRYTWQHALLYAPDTTTQKSNPSV